MHADAVLCMIRSRRQLDVVVCFGAVVCDLLVVAVLLSFAVLFVLLFAVCRSAAGCSLFAVPSRKENHILFLFLAVVCRLPFVFFQIKNRNYSVFSSTPKNGQATR